MRGARHRRGRCPRPPRTARGSPDRARSSPHLVSRNSRSRSICGG